MVEQRISKSRQKLPSKNLMRTVGISNSLNLAGVLSERICICFFTSDAHPHQRGGRGARYSVYFNDRKTDPKAHWADYGRKTFEAYYNKEKAIAEAIEWTNAKYSQRSWIRDPWGSYQDARTIAAAWMLIDKQEAITE